MHEEVSMPELTEAVARLSALLGPRQGAVSALPGGFSNRAFRVNLGGEDYVVRLPGKDDSVLGIDREAERLATRGAAELGLGPRVATMLEDPPYLVTAFIPSRMVTSGELRQPDCLTRVGRGLRAFHESGVELPTEFSVVRTVRTYADIARSHGGTPPAEFDEALARADQVVEAVAGHRDHERRPCHNDLLTANFLRSEKGLLILDWEYAGMGDPFFDLGNFAANNELFPEDEEGLLEAYFGEGASGRRLAALRLFRFMSEFREAMWGVVQATTSELDFDFAAYAQRHVGRLAQAIGNAHFAAWLEEASGG